jgi:hypothetical protein
MAKKVTRKLAASAKRGTGRKSAAPRKAAPAKRASSKPKKTPAPRRQKPESTISASDALVGLLESPLVADVLAAGAAAALASFTHHRLTRRRDGNSKQALKDAAKAAATAMGARLHDEFDEILESSKKAKRAKA